MRVVGTVMHQEASRKLSDIAPGKSHTQQAS